MTRRLRRLLPAITVESEAHQWAFWTAVDQHAKPAVNTKRLPGHEQGFSAEGRGRRKPGAAGWRVASVTKGI